MRPASGSRTTKQVGQLGAGPAGLRELGHVHAQHVVVGHGGTHLLLGPVGLEADEVGGGDQPRQRVLLEVRVLGHPGHRQRVQRLQQQGAQPGDPHQRLGVQPPGDALGAEESREASDEAPFAALAETPASGTGLPDVPGLLIAPGVATVFADGKRVPGKGWARHGAAREPALVRLRHRTKHRLIQYPIPGNDDAVKSVKFIAGLITDSIIEGRKEFLAGKKAQAQTAAVEVVAA